jgi:Flp pilus assembly protein TadG
MFRTQLMQLLRNRRSSPPRRGVVAVLAAVFLVVLFGFVAFAVDTGVIHMTQTKMQNAVDAASLAASEEITNYIYAAGQGESSATVGGSSTAVANARTMAAEIGEANGVFIDPENDVQFGKRVFDAASNTWPIQWGSEPYNVVKVTARRTNEDTSAPDGQLPLTFGWALNKSSASLETSSTAFVESRDIVVVLDFSSSMNDDSCMRSFGNLGQSSVEANMDGIWNSLVEAAPKWPGTTETKFPSTGFGQVNSYYGTYVSSTTTSTIFNTLGLGEQVDGKPKYPFPQSGKDGSGNFKPRPNTATSETLWKGYIDYVKNLSGPYNKRYGYRTLLDYLMESREQNHTAEDLWRTQHYPFHAIKEGCTLFLEFLGELQYGDEVGLVSYADNARVESVLSEDGYSINLSSDPISIDYNSVNVIQRHKQAGHYESNTGIGYGVKEARLLLENHSRYRSRRTMLLMTDGLANKYPSGWSLPASWSWAALTDYNDDGVADYTTTDKSKQFAFWEAKKAIDAGITIHTLSVGAGADRDFMKAVAFAAGGSWIDVPGGSTVAEMQSQLLDAFSQIAAKVPAAKLTYDD